MGAAGLQGLLTVLESPCHLPGWPLCRDWQVHTADGQPMVHSGQTTHVSRYTLQTRPVLHHEFIRSSSQTLTLAMASAYEDYTHHCVCVSNVRASAERIVSMPSLNLSCIVKAFQTWHFNLQPPKTSQYSPVLNTDTETNWVWTDTSE